MLDPRQLEVLFQFSKFLEIVSDPDELKRFLVESKEVLAQQEKYLGLITTKEQADKYLADAKKLQEDTKKQVEEDLAKCKEQVSTMQDRATFLRTEAEQNNDASLKDKEEAKKTLIIANALLEEAKTKSEKAEKLSFELSVREGRMNQREIDLSEKSKKLQELIGT